VRRGAWRFHDSIFAFAAQDRGRQDGARFDDNARQATQNWYNQNKDHPPAGLRSQDRLSADQESRYTRARFSIATYVKRCTRPRETSTNVCLRRQQQTATSRWGGMSVGSTTADVSGGKVIRHQSRKSNNRVANALRMAAQSL